MSLKKDLKSKTEIGQAIVEYMVSFLILVVAIITVFLAFSPERLGVRGTFGQAVGNAVEYINRQTGE